MKERAQAVDNSINIIGVTANCGNDTLGVEACKAIKALLIRETDPADVVIINCQEAHLAKTLEQLEQVKSPSDRIRITNAGLMTTITKFETLSLNTGMTTIVLSRTDKITDVTLVQKQSQKEIRGDNRNKGGYLNTFNLTTTEKTHFTIRTVSGAFRFQ